MTTFHSVFIDYFSPANISHNSSTYFNKETRHCIYTVYTAALPFFDTFQDTPVHLTVRKMSVVKKKDK